LRDCVPAKITSGITLPRSALALCSPSTQRTASETLLLPLPLGPTTPVMRPLSSMSVFSGKDLNPDISICFKNKSEALFPLFHPGLQKKIGITAECCANLANFYQQFD
jgi:hypothetical protein